MNILFRYTGIPLDPSFESFTGHAGKWCWWAIAQSIKELGHVITPLNWSDDFTPSQVYDAIFSIQHLHGLEGAYNADTVKIFRLTMCDAFYHNRTIKARVNAVNARRNANLQYRRLLPEYVNHYRSYDLADAIFLNGNDHNRWTYPDRYWRKIIPMNTCAANVVYPEMRKHIPRQRAFLYHAGAGAIHKGLDLVLEAFARHPEWRLHITSNLRGEPDFMKEFAYEFSLPNITYYGWTVVQSSQFQRILSECYAFVLPTCSEGQSPAVATCLTLGLYPVISRFTGIDLPDGCGLFIEELTVDCVEEMIQKLIDTSDKEVLRQVSILQSDAIVKYGREKFRETMKGYLKEFLGEATTMAVD